VGGHRPFLTVRSKIQRGPQSRLGHDPEAFLQVTARLRPVVVGRHIGDPVAADIQAVLIEVRNGDVGPEVSRDFLSRSKRMTCTVMSYLPSAIPLSDSRSM
jgi:hypothetical protein